MYNVSNSETRYTDETGDMGLRINERSVRMPGLTAAPGIILPKTAEFDETQVEVNYDKAGRSNGRHSGL